MASSTGHPSQVPVIDISGTLPELEVGRALVDAAATYGFVYIKNEGKDIPVEAIDRMFELSKQFFSSPVEEKEKCRITETNRGWGGMQTETLDVKNQRVGDFKEAMNIGGFVDGKAQQPLPASLADHEAEIDQFQKYCHELVLKVLTLFGLGLEIDPLAGGSSWFATRHRDGANPSILRLLYYPHLSRSDYQPGIDIRAGAHSDYGSLTLLFQRPGQPGLEIRPPGSDGWTPIPVQPPTTEQDPSPPILVNTGDLLASWTDNLLRSTVHRVVFPVEDVADRYSIAYFAHPVGTTVLEAVPSAKVREKAKEKEAEGESVQEREARRAMTADEYLFSRLKATYLGLYGNGKTEGKAVTA